jgi:hypothetical protein
MTSQGEVVLEAHGLTKHFRVRSRMARGQRRARAVVRPPRAPG